MNAAPTSAPAAASTPPTLEEPLHTVRATADKDSLHTTLGVLGGGQLGRMLVHTAQRMGYGTIVLDPAVESPAGQASHNQIVAGFTDMEGWQRLAAASDAITTEFENVPAAALDWLAARKPVSPPAKAVAIAQNRILEKEHFTRCGAPCVPYQVIEPDFDMAELDRDLLPGIIKTARLGYDGKGQARVSHAQDLEAALARLKHVPCVLEKRLALAMECSVIVARGADGSMVHFQPQRNAHYGSILATTYAFAEAMPAALADELCQATLRLAEQMDYVGVLCVEYFVLEDGSWVVNEMAPRPHNSGHYTIDACDHSQFELQVRTTMHLPLVQPRHHSAAIMLNLLGDIWLDKAGEVQPPPWEATQHMPGVSLHLYGKQTVRHGRKMGHITITAASAEEVQDKAEYVAAALSLPFERLPPADAA